MGETFVSFHTVAWISVTLGVLSSLYIIWETARRQRPHMAIMMYVWPINALWGSVFIVWAYCLFGKTPCKAVARARSMQHTDQMKRVNPLLYEGGAKATQPRATMEGGEHMKVMVGMSNNDMDDMSSTPMWQSILTGTMHCGAGCTLADIVGGCFFAVSGFALLGSRVFGEWAGDYVLALFFGVFFQYAGLVGMGATRGGALWWKAFKVDVLSLSAWQIGMYAWMGLAIFGFGLELSPATPLYWFMMQVAMLCGYITAFPVNWWLVRAGIKSAM